MSSGRCIPDPKGVNFVDCLSNNNTPYFNKNTENNSNSELILETNKDIITTSRNSKGQPATFKSLIEVKFTVKDGDKILKQKIFSESFDYNNIENKYDLSVYQTDVEDNLIKQITEDLIIYMNIK